MKGILDIEHHLGVDVFATRLKPSPALATGPETACTPRAARASAEQLREEIAEIATVVRRKTTV